MGVAFRASALVDSVRMPAVLVAGVYSTVVQNCRSSPAAVVTHCTFPSRDGKAELLRTGNRNFIEASNQLPLPTF